MTHSDILSPSRPRRRAVLKGVALACAGAALPVAAQTPAIPEIPAMASFVAGRTVRWDNVAVDTPRLADNGYSVSLKLGVTPGLVVTSLHLFSEKNPQPVIAVFHFGPDTPRVQVETRVRLGGSQRIVAIASTATGALYGGLAEVLVTIAACIEG